MFEAWAAQNHSLYNEFAAWLAQHLKGLHQWARSVGFSIPNLKELAAWLAQHSKFLSMSSQLGLLKTQRFTMNSEPDWLDTASVSNEFAAWVAQNHSVYNEFAACLSQLRKFPNESATWVAQNHSFTMNSQPGWLNTTSFSNRFTACVNQNHKFSNELAACTCQNHSFYNESAARLGPGRRTYDFPMELCAGIFWYYAREASKGMQFALVLFSVLCAVCARVWMANNSRSRLYILYIYDI